MNKNKLFKEEFWSQIQYIGFRIYFPNNFLCDSWNFVYRHDKKQYSECWQLKMSWKYFFVYNLHDF